MLFSSYLKEKAMKRSTERFETVSMVLLKYRQYKGWMKLFCWRVALLYDIPLIRVLCDCT